ncbi:MAG TPA: Uma2 family endonuclease [Symbiobacteriaceae bacterium]|nr:Uma2 family endonuclease [Symbiobacteriaceae bacterium]
MLDPRVKITYEDYLQLPEEQRYEVLEGDLRMVPARGVPHQKVLYRLTKVVGDFVDQQGLGTVLFAPLDVILADDSVVQPDLLFIRNDRLAILKTEGVRGAPDLVVEVLAPNSTAKRDRGIKRRLYGRYGVQEYWLVDPQERTVEVACQRDGALETVSLAQGDAGVRSLLFPDLAIALSDLFRQ